MIAASVSEDASKAAIPAAYPARKGAVTPDSSPYAQAAIDSIAKTEPPVTAPVRPRRSNAVISLVAQTILGKISVEEGTGADAGRRREGDGEVLIRPSVEAA